MSFSCKTCLVIIATAFLGIILVITQNAFATTNCNDPPNPEVNWAGCDLAGRNLSDANLQGANLTGTNLEYANLFDANLHSANLQHANLRNSNMGCSHETCSNLLNANLQDANMRNVTLTYASLFYASLRGADLSSANLKGVTLESADLTDANLEGANLQGAHMYGANLVAANLNHADLVGADLRGANVVGANLSYANFGNNLLTSIILENATLRHVELTKVYLDNVNLKGANLLGANLDDTSMVNAELKGANLHNANLHDAKLRGAKLQNADLSQSILTTADLSNADLNGTNLSGAILKDTIITGTNLNNIVKFPTPTLAPLKQILFGFHIEDVVCSPGKLLVTKWSNSSAACVEPLTAGSLVKLRWGTIREPILSISPSFLASGAEIHINGQRFQGNSSISIFFDDALSLANTKTDSWGRFETVINVPSNTSIGYHNVKVKDAVNDIGAGTVQVLSAEEAMKKQEEITRKETYLSLNFSITGGQVIKIESDPKSQVLIISLANTSNGNISITIPRTMVDARIGSQDDQFFVLNDGEEVKYNEIAKTSTDRTLSIPFAEGTQKIEIIGTSLLSNME